MGGVQKTSVLETAREGKLSTMRGRGAKNVRGKIPEKKSRKKTQNSRKKTKKTETGCVFFQKRRPFFPRITYLKVVGHSLEEALWISVYETAIKYDYAKSMGYMIRPMNGCVK